MRMLSAAAVLALASTAHAAPPPPGTYTNEEEVYFDREMKRAPAPWVGITIDSVGKPSFVDAYGKLATATVYKALAVSGPGRVKMTFADGRVTELRMGRPLTCWGAIRKDAPKPDGSEDFAGKFGLKLHDQGGRVMFGGEPGVKAVVLRVRNVTWSDSARSSNRPSLVLYVHTPDNPDHAVSYVWSDPGASRLGVNLRWMQASCTVDGMERGATGNEVKAN